MSVMYPRVVEATLDGFLCAYVRYEEQPFELGAFVTVDEGRYPVVGVVSKVESGPEDSTRPLQPRGAPGQPAAAILEDEQHIRMLLRTQARIVACGYRDGSAIRAWLPPLPCPLLAEVRPATGPEVIALVADGTFIERLVHGTGTDDSVLAAALRAAARDMGNEADAFRVRAGKELARLLRADPARVATVLRKVAT